MSEIGGFEFGVMLLWFPKQRIVERVVNAGPHTQMQNPACVFSKTSHRIASGCNRLRLAPVVVANVGTLGDGAARDCSSA